LCNINLALILADGVGFVGAGDLTITITISVAMAQLTVMLRVNNVANMETGSPLALVLADGVGFFYGACSLCLISLIIINMKNYGLYTCFGYLNDA
jgi:hypothetical protein